MLGNGVKWLICGGFTNRKDNFRHKAQRGSKSPRNGGEKTSMHGDKNHTCMGSRIILEHNVVLVMLEHNVVFVIVALCHALHSAITVLSWICLNCHCFYLYECNILFGKKFLNPYFSFSLSFFFCHHRFIFELHPTAGDQGAHPRRRQQQASLSGTLALFSLWLLSK